MHRDSFATALGWVGAACILVAYAGNSFSVFSHQDSAYLFLNLVGSLGIIVETYRKKATAPLFLNIVWATIACIGLLKTIMKI